MIIMGKNNYVPFEVVKKDYEIHGCKLLIEENEYHGKKTIAPYICACGNV